ncbi:hypothetical protein V2W45_1473168 [Cenococcum geophilum]
MLRQSVASRTARRINLSERGGELVRRASALRLSSEWPMKCSLIPATTYSNLLTRSRLALVWAEFPKERLTGFTSILLRLRQQVDHWMLAREMKKLDARLLMFLQNLKEVEISVFENQFHDNSPYIIFRYPVSNLPKEEKRRNCNKSEIVLAFLKIVASPPGQQQEEQKAVSQKTHKVYSFLPIRDYGFKFEIKYTSKWNKALRNCIPSALLKAITKFNASDFRYCWPHFFPNIKTLLSEKAVLELTGGNLMFPSALVLVPIEFTNINRQPLIPSGCSKFTYVSPKYPVEISDALKSLGLISSLRFIPLRDGIWIAPQAGPLLFPLVSDNLVIPDKIGPFIVHLDAASNHT